MAKMLFEDPVDASPEMEITCIAPWFGSKRTLAPTIVKELGPHRAYWSIFGGSLADLMVKPPCSMETVNDLHGHLINLARVLADETKAIALYERLSRTLMHEIVFRECAEEVRSYGNVPANEEGDVDRAYAYFVAAWCGRNGVAGTASTNYNFCARYTKNGGHAAKRFISATESIPAWHHRLRNVTILNRNAFELLSKIEDASGVVIYCDPPYVEKGAKYLHDFTPEDHVRLAEALRRFRYTRVVVSYYEHPEVRRLYDGWRFVACTMTKSLVNQGMRDKGGAVKAPELIIVNQ